MTDSCVVNDCKYAKELDALSECISQHHPIGKVKHIGRMEVVQAVREVIAERDAEIERLREIIIDNDYDILSNTYHLPSPARRSN